MTTAITTTTNQRQLELKRFLNTTHVMETIRKGLPPNMNAERLVLQALTLCSNNPGLVDCSHFSVLKGIIQSGELGLDLSGVLGHAYLVPRWSSRDKCKLATFQVGYRGMIKLAYNSGMVRSLSYSTVRKGEQFDFLKGTSAFLRHKQLLEGVPGEVIAYYAVAQLVDHGTDFEVISLQATKEHRDRYSPKGNRDSAWDTNFDAMALKTVLRMLAKRLPTSVELVTAAVLDEHHEAGVFDRNLMELPALGARSEQLAEELAAGGVVPDQPKEFDGGPEPMPGE